MTKLLALLFTAVRILLLFSFLVESRDIFDFMSFSCIPFRFLELIKTTLFDVFKTESIALLLIDFRIFKFESIFWCGFLCSTTKNSLDFDQTPKAIHL